MVNPNILKWARETAGYSIEAAVKALAIKDLRDTSALERLEQLEAGKQQPTRPLLLKMAKKYRRPLLAFYLAEPPKTGDRGEDFRTLPRDYEEKDDSLLNTLLRDVIARHGLISSALIDEAETHILKYVASHKVTDSPKAISKSIKKYFDINLDLFREQKTPEAAFKYLRDQIEKAGVFVLLIGDLGSHHTKIEVKTFRGYSIADSIAPFIVINDNDSHRAWSFTLLHELTHIMLGQTGVSNAFSSIQVEKLCNRTAGDILLPTAELSAFGITQDSTYEDLIKAITNYANSTNVSSTMVAYKLYLENIIEQDVWIQLTETYHDLWVQNQLSRTLKNREKEGGPSYYTIKYHRVGSALIDVINRFLYSGAITTTKAGKVLGVKPTNVHKLISSADTVQTPHLN